jgi:signal transduction histidine kinase
MELSNLEQLRVGDGHQFQCHLEASRHIAVQALNTVRDLATGLRPSILDDLGLEPALQWQAREFSRRSGVPVTVDIRGNLENLSDLHSTCVYRIVQEALTNCAKHANARAIEVRLKGDADELSLIVRDDGVGFNPRTVPGTGLGLIGIEERVREMGGRLKVSSRVGNGTHLHVSIPLLQEARV